MIAAAAQLPQGRRDLLITAVSKSRCLKLLLPGRCRQQGHKATFNRADSKRISRQRDEPRRRNRNAEQDKEGYLP